jgi:fermentation-respiration switch protein FrsA (DUF1100 family)
MCRNGSHQRSLERNQHGFAFVRALGVFLPALTLMLFLSGCSCHLNVPESAAWIQTRASMKLNGVPFELRLSKPTGASSGNVLIIYATGDGGWLGLGTDIFNWLASWNYPVAGFSSRSYLHHLGYTSETETTTPRMLARDYESIIAFAESRLGLPASTPIILVGMSRGAGLSVVAAGAGSLDQRLAGLLAIALTKEEEHVLHRARRTAPANGQARRPRVMIETYRYLNRVGPFPVMVLQSTHDGYLPADEARKLFGPDSELRKLRAVESTNHGFHNGCQTLYQDAEDALKWIIGFIPGHGKD